MPLDDEIDEIEEKYKKDQWLNKEIRTPADYKAILQNHYNWVLVEYAIKLHPDEHKRWTLYQLQLRLENNPEIKSLRELLDLRHAHYITYTNSTREKNEATKKAFLVARQKLLDKGVVDAAHVPNIIMTHLPYDKKVPSERTGLKRPTSQRPFTYRPQTFTRPPEQAPPRQAPPRQTPPRQNPPRQNPHWQSYSVPPPPRQPPPREPPREPPKDFPRQDLPRETSDRESAVLAQLRALNPPVTTKREGRQWQAKYHPDKAYQEYVRVHGVPDARKAEEIKKTAQETFQQYTPLIQEATEKGWIK